MWKKLVQFTARPRTLLRRVLALNDSAHAIALGVAIGIFIGLTPTVGVQTILVLGLVVATRKLVYFNATAAMASTYVSNPITMVPMYYTWYRIGAWFSSGTLTAEEFESMLLFDGMAGWWDAMYALGAQVAFPMCIGALLTAPIGVAIAYPATYLLVTRVRGPKRPSDPNSPATEDTAPQPNNCEVRIDASNDPPTPPERTLTPQAASRPKPVASS